MINKLFFHSRSPALVNLHIAASRFSEAATTSSTPAISSFFSTENRESGAEGFDAETEHASNTNTPNPSSPATPCNPYEGCAIDTSVLESLPPDIRFEIKQSLRKDKAGKEHKRNEGIRRFFTPVPSTSGRNSSSLESTVETQSVTASSRKRKMPFCYEADAVSRVLDEKCQKMIDPDMVECDKCGKLFSAWVMPEHLDYHFAKTLQEKDEVESRTCAMKERQNNDNDFLERTLQHRQENKH